MKILLVDDHPIFLEGLKSLLAIRGYEVAGTARNGLDAVEQADTLLPDIILMDVVMPGCNGLTALRMIKKLHPDIKVVMLTMSENDEELFAAIQNGAFGYLLKTDDTDVFFTLLEGLMQGEAPLSQGLAARILGEFASRNQSVAAAGAAQTEETLLTRRQIQVLTLVARGLTYKEIGTQLYLTERTIKYHMGEIIDRLHLENRRQAIEFARAMKFGEE